MAGGAVGAVPEEIARRVDLRLERQEHPRTAKNSPKFWAVIDEAALRRPVGGVEVMRGEIQHLHRT